MIANVHLLQLIRFHSFVCPTAKYPDINNLSLTELMNNIFALDPFNKELVVKVSQAEAEFWRKSEGPGIHGRVDAAHRESKYTTTCSYRTFGVRAA
ncbi:hypothetical protein FRX31_004474 [Thalictrum thalictroides]|uniref:Uncharacterized protein n=1 Tax=Thalictrum thalictroides TaxID=46969 RepID=A0A7J6XBV5_THATH|nr:hypothetical protein FRX31_004474 [Thalictrum thalictroides]